MSNRLQIIDLQAYFPDYFPDCHHYILLLKMTFDDEHDPKPALNSKASTASSRQDKFNEKASSAHDKESGWGFPSSTSPIREVESTAVNHGHSRNDFDWNDLPPLSRRPSAVRQSSPHATQQDLSLLVNKTLQSVLKGIAELDSKLETHTDYVENGFQSVCWHIHELGSERKKADATANKLRKSISRRVTNIIDMAIEDNNGIQRRLSDFVDMGAEDIAEVRRKVEASSKIQDGISRKVTTLIDLIIEGLPEILEERGLICRCRRAPSDHDIAARNVSGPSACRSQPQPANPLFDLDGALARLGRYSWQQRSPDNPSRAQNTSLPSHRPDFSRAACGVAHLARNSDDVPHPEATSPRRGGRKEAQSVRSQFLKAFLEDEEDEHLL